MIELRKEARENFLTCAVAISISTAVVALRFFTRFYLSQKLILSDYLCVLSLAVFGTYCGLLINCT
jgi:VIT1/CCC1 family predicted Fe2+/Mn2+ transporter